MQNRFAEDSGVRRYKGKTRSNAPTISDNPHQCVRAAAQQFSPPVNGKQKRVGSRPDGAPVQRQSDPSGSSHPSQRNRKHTGSTGIHKTGHAASIATGSSTPISVMQTQSYKDPVFYTPGDNKRAPQVIDVGDLTPTGQIIGRFSQEPIEKLRQRYPLVRLGEFDEIVKQKERMLSSPPKRISQTDFIRALEVLPPEGYKVNAEGETFKSCERLSGRITSIYARIGSAYYSFKDVFTLPHHEILRRVGQEQAKAVKAVAA